MTLDVAIKIDEEMEREQERLNNWERVNALKLGIEALKVIKGFEDICPVSCHLMLPGETEK